MNTTLQSEFTKFDRVQEVIDYLDRHMNDRQVNKILHGFPSPRLWLEKNVPMKEVMALRKKHGENKAKAFHLYIGTPYCIRTDPEKCGYCLFPVEVFTGMKQLEKYLHYLKLEGQIFKNFFEGVELSGIYFGGGTSNLYKAEQYPQLMEMIKDVFPKFSPDITITMEGIPQLYTWEKLVNMKAAGINRISMGAQQLNDELNKLSGRQQKVQHVYQAIEWCQTLELECNVDLIFGWPQQTIDLMLRDLENLVKTGIRHITHYELNIGGPSDFAINRRNELPSVQENLEMYRASKQFLEENGFQQLSVYDFEKTEKNIEEENFYVEGLRGFKHVEMWGWGYAGLSIFPGTAELPGWTYLNATKVEDYFNKLDKGDYPIERGFHFERQDLQLNGLFRSLQTMEANLIQYKNYFNIDLLEEFWPIWQALVEKKWAIQTPQKIKIVGDGGFYVPLIETLLASKRIAELKEKSFSQS